MFIFLFTPTEGLIKSLQKACCIETKSHASSNFTAVKKIMRKIQLIGTSSILSEFIEQNLPEVGISCRNKHVLKYDNSLKFSSKFVLSFYNSFARVN